MLRNAKDFSITTHLREIYIVRKFEGGLTHEPCSQCRDEVEMLTLDDAVTYTAKPASELLRQLNAGSIHSIETASGHMFMCKRSLANIRS